MYFKTDTAMPSYDIGYPEPRKVAQLAYQPSCDGYQQDDRQKHHDESSGS